MKAPLTYKIENHVSYNKKNLQFPPSSSMILILLITIAFPALIYSQDATQASSSAATGQGKCPINILSGSSTTAPTTPPASSAPTLSRVNQLTCVQYATSEVSPDGQKLIKRSATNKNTVAFAPNVASQRGNVSPTLRGSSYVRVLPGASLFPSNPDLSAGIDSLAVLIQKAGQSTQKNSADNTTTQVSYFVPIFRKIQFMVLNDLYIYLTALYSTFNMTHASDEPTYLSEEPSQALNKKSLIVSHLLNVIQGQMYYICSTQQPLMPQQLGLKGGALLIQQDLTVDPTFLIKDFSKPLFDGDLTSADQKAAHATFTQTQNTYLDALKQTINFFTQYTNYITKPDPSSTIPGANAFASIASHVATVIATDPYHVGVAKIKTMPSTQASIGGASGSKLANTTSITTANVASQATTQKIAALRNLQKQTPPINPPFFYYDADTLRALKVVPKVASELAPNTTSIGWPSQLITAAQNGTQARTRGGGQAGQGQSLGYAIAYFLDAQGNRTQDVSKAAQLFINLATDNGPYAQEIKKQPNWLNSTTGIINVLRACLGDYSQLIGLNILNSCTEQIICKALGISCAAQPSQAACQKEVALVNQVQQEYMQNLKTVNSGTGAPETGSSTSTATPTTPAYDPSSALAGAGYLSGGQAPSTTGT